VNSIVRYLARVAASAGLYGANLLEHTEVRKNCAFLFFYFLLSFACDQSVGFFFLSEDLFYISAFYCALLCILLLV